jgi:hypothetical protein
MNLLFRSNPFACQSELTFPYYRNFPKLCLPPLNRDGIGRTCARFVRLNRRFRTSPLARSSDDLLRRYGNFPLPIPTTLRPQQAMPQAVACCGSEWSSLHSCLSLFLSWAPTSHFVVVLHVHMCITMTLCSLQAMPCAVACCGLEWSSLCCRLSLFLLWMPISHFRVFWHIHMCATVTLRYQQVTPFAVACCRSEWSSLCSCLPLLSPWMLAPCFVFLRVRTHAAVALHSQQATPCAVACCGSEWSSLCSCLPRFSPRMLAPCFVFFFFCMFTHMQLLLCAPSKPRLVLWLAVGWSGPLLLPISFLSLGAETLFRCFFHKFGHLQLQLFAFIIIPSI